MKEIKRITKAVIPAAGYGTRFLPITKGFPKEMLPIYDKPTLHYIVKEAVDSGCTDILIIVSEGKDSIKKYFSRSECPYAALKDRSRLKELDELLERANISFVTQTELNGNGAAIQLAKPFTGNDPFVVLFGDDVIKTEKNPVARQLITAYQTTGKIILGVQEMSVQEAILYGCVQKGKTNGRYTNVVDLIEKPTIDKIPSTLCSLGRFLLTPEIYAALLSTPTHFGEIYLTDAIARLAKEDRVVAYNFEGQRFDLGNKCGFVEANIVHALESENGDRLKAFIKTLF